MQLRNMFLGGAAGFTAGYAAYRAYESLCAREAPPNPARDPAAYGAARRAVALAGIARSLANSIGVAYGPPGERMQRRVERAPRWSQPILFVLQVALADAIVELPVEFVEDHRIERRYALSDQSASSWLVDYGKQQAIGAVVTAGLSGLLGAALRRSPRRWPYAVCVATIPLLLLGNIVIPLWVMPLFNAYTPLEGPLADRLRALAARLGAGDAQIFRTDMSKQTKKANAFVIGIGTTHRIVLGDTLIEHFTPEEIEFVIAHELGHYVAKDTWRMTALAEATACVTVFAAFFALGKPSDILAQQPRTLARIQFWVTLAAQILRPALGAFSRSREWAADRFALAVTRDPQTGASALRRLRDQNLAEDEQPAWYEFMFSTHPPLKARIAALELHQQG